MASTNVGSIHYDLDLKTSNFDAATRSVGSKLTTIGKSAEKLATGMLVFGTAMAFAGKKALDNASDYQQSRIAFDTMLGSAEKGVLMMKQLNDFAKRTPFSLPEVVQGAKGLLAYGIEAEKIIPTFNALGNIAAGVGKDKLPQLTLAFGQVRTAGKLTGMELRQFTEAGVPLLDALAQQSGKSASQIKQDMENGLAPSFAEVEQAIMSMSQNGGKFYNLMEKQSQTFSGRMSNIGDSVGQIIRGMLGVDVEGNVTPGSVFDKVTKAAEGLMNWLQAHQEQIIGSIQAIFGFIIDHGKEIAIFVGTILTAAFISWGIAVASATWPILLIAAGVTALFVLVQKFWPQIRAVTDAFISVYQSIWNFLKPAFDVLWPILVQIAQWVGGQLKQAWDQFSAAIAQLWVQLQPFMPQLKILAIILGVVVMTPLVAIIAMIGVFIGVATAVVVIVAKVIAFFADLSVMIMRAANSFQSAVSNGFQSVLNFFRGLPGSIVGALGDVGRMLYGSGQAIIQGLINGITSMAGRVKDAVQNVLQKARDLLPFSPAKEGPFSGKGWTLYSGQSMMQGLADGIRSMASLPRQEMSNAMGQVSSSMSIYGNVNIGNTQTADYFFSRQLNRQGQLASMGLSGATL